MADLVNDEVDDSDLLQRLRSLKANQDEEGRKDEAAILRVAGADLSFFKEAHRGHKAALAYVVLEFGDIVMNKANSKKCQSSFKVVYQDARLVNLRAPYIPGYLAFREKV